MCWWKLIPFLWRYKRLVSHFLSLDGEPVRVILNTLSTKTKWVSLCFPSFFFFSYILAVRYVSTLRLCWFEVFLNFVAKNMNGQHFGHQVRDTHSQCKRSRRFISVNINQILISMFVTGFLSASSFCEHLWSFDYRAPGTNRSLRLATNFAKTWLATDAHYKFTHTSKIFYTYIF